MGTIDGRLPSSPETAVLRSCEMEPIHSRALESLNDVLTLGNRVITSARAKGSEVAPISRKRWPKA